MTNPFDVDHTIPKLTVETVDWSRTAFIEGASLDAALREEVAAADVLLVPLPGHAGYSAPVFPQGTMEVLHYLRENLPEGMRADIAVTDEAYEELTLHAAEIVLPTFLTDTVFVDIAISLIASYLYDLIKDASARRETRVRTCVLVETDQRTVSIAYDGPADQFTELTRQALAGEISEAEQARDRASERTGEPKRLLDASGSNVLRLPIAPASEATPDRTSAAELTSQERQVANDLTARREE